MYLEKRTYVKQWDHQKPEERFAVTVGRGGKPFTDIDPKRVSYVTEQVGYWRKANAIHRWFVDNVQGGADDCKEYYLDREKLTELRETCEKVIGASKLVKGKIGNGQLWKDGNWETLTEDGRVIEDPSVAMALLPTQEGCFFGGTDYDEYYLSDLSDTVAIVNDALRGDLGDYYYQASW